MQHLQRAGRIQMTLFQAFYFVIVTFSTVGYGEFYPDYWLSQLWVIATICTACPLLPSLLLVEVVWSLCGLGSPGAADAAGEAGVHVGGAGAERGRVQPPARQDGEARRPHHLSPQRRAGHGLPQ